MSYLSPSRVEENPIGTLADVISAVRAADLPERRRQEIIAALHTAARALDRPPERVPADPWRLLPRLKQIAPRAIGLSRGRWTNTRSLTRAGIALLYPVPPVRSRQRLTERWAALYDQLESRWTKLKVSRFVRFSSSQGVEPAAVTEATFAAFRQHLDDKFLHDPDKIYAALVDGWRAAQTAVDSWPQLRITIPSRRNEWTFAWECFPLSLQADCMAWCDRLAGRDLLDEAPFRPVKPSTVKRREWQIRGFATALVLRGRDPKTITSLRDLIEIESYKEGLRYLIERAGGKPTTAIYDVASSLKMMASHHLQVDRAHLDRMAAIIRRLDVGPRGLTEKNRTRLRQLDDPQQASALLRLPLELIEIAARNQKLHAGALQAQTAVAFEILLMAPIRIDNLAALDLEQNLIRPGRGPEMHIVIEREDVKNGEPLDYPLPPPSVALFEQYLTKYRPRLAPPGCTALFPGRDGGPKSLNALRDQIAKTVHRHTGMQMHPHLFRHAMAKLYLDANPGAYEVVRRVLGHRSINTTTAFYTGLETAPAVRHFDKTILKLRKDADTDDQNPSS
jgi:integrase